MNPATQRWTTGVAAASAVVMTLDITIVNVALPAIGRELSMSLPGAQWVVNAYTLVFAALLLGVGSVSDRVGRRSIFLIGHLAFALTSAAGVLASTEATLISSRAGQGLGAALVFGTTIPLIADAFGTSERTGRTKAIALVSAISGLASAMGPLVGGLIVEWASWRWVFGINVPLCATIAVITLLRVPDQHIAATTRSPHQTPPVDPASIIVAVVGLLALNYTILTAPLHGWLAPGSLTAAAVSLIALTGFGLRQRQRGHAAMLDLSLFRIPTFSAITVVAFTVRLFSFGLFPFLILWLSGAFHFGPVQVGLTLLAMGIPMLVVAVLAARLCTLMRVGRILAVGMWVVAAGLTMGLLVRSDAPWWALLPSFVLIGVGSGITFPYLMDVAVSVVPAHRSGIATGTANTAFPLGTSAGVAVYGALITARIGSLLANQDEPVRAATTAGQFDTVRQISAALHDSAMAAFASGLRISFLVAAATATLTGYVCWRWIRDEDRWQEPEGSLGRLT